MEKGQQIQIKKQQNIQDQWMAISQYFRDYEDNGLHLLFPISNFQILAKGERTGRQLQNSHPFTQARDKLSTEKA